MLEFLISQMGARPKVLGCLYVFPKCINKILSQKWSIWGPKLVAIWDAVGPGWFHLLHHSVSLSSSFLCQSS